MAISSIFDKFVIDSNEVMDIFLNTPSKKDKIKTPKIDIQKKIEQGKEVLKTF